MNTRTTLLSLALAALCCALVNTYQLQAASYIKSPLGGGGALRTENCDAYAAGTITNLPPRAGPFTIEGYIYVPQQHALMDFPGFLFYQDGFACVEIYGGTGLNSGKYYLWFGVATGVPNEFDGPLFLGYWATIDAGWHHIACVNDPGASQRRVYLDGIITVPGYNNTTTFGGPRPPSNRGCIGGALYPNSYYWGFYWDEIRVSRSARYAANFAPPTQAFSPDSDTAALWHFDETCGAIEFRDSSGNGNTLDAVNSASVACLGIRLQISTTTGTEVPLALFGETGRQYTIQWCTNLSVTTWRDLTNVVLTGPSTNILDELAGQPPTKFYRAYEH